MVAGRGNLVAFEVEELVRWHIVRQVVVAMCLEHGWEDDAMEHDVVLTDEVDETAFRVLPPLLPCAQFRVRITKFLRIRDVTDRRIEPHIKHFALGTFHWHRNTPVEVASHSTRFQSRVEPRLALSIHVWSPFLMFFKNPLFEPRLIVVERQIPMLGATLHERIARVGIVWIDEFIGRKCCTTLLALVSVRLWSMATRTLATDVAVGEELLLSLIVVLVAFYLHKLAFVVELAEEISSKLVMDGRSGATIDIERNAEVGKRFLNQIVIAVHHVLRCATFFLGTNRDRHSVLIATSNE